MLGPRRRSSVPRRRPLVGSSVVRCLRARVQHRPARVPEQLKRRPTMTQAPSTNGSTPTVAIVHGAFADSAGWNDVVAQLLGEGLHVRAVSNPLRGIAHDAAY